MSTRPMAQVSPLANLGAIAPDSDASASTAPRRGEILLIEDCTEVREGLAQLLELHGYMVTEFADGERGMRELTTQPQAFALVILDLMLGESMAGMEFRLQQLLDSQLRSEEHTSELQSLRHLVCRLLLEKKKKKCSIV